MKKVVIAFLITIILMCSSNNVYAKDTVYTINKHRDEEFKYIIKGYTDTKEDGYILSGTYKDTVKNEEKEYEINKIFVVKYDKTGNIIWKYEQEDEDNSKLINIMYSYDSSSNINGYILVENKTNSETEAKKTVFVILNQNGKEIREVEANTSENIDIKKAITIKEENKVSYILIGTIKKDEKSIGLIAKYDSNYNKEWEKEYNEESTTEISLEDIIKVEDQFVAISKVKKDEETKHQLLRFSKEGDFLKVIKEDFAERVEPSLIGEDKEYIVYGKTFEVKVNNKSESYYLKKFDNKDEVLWESIGNDSIDATKVVDIQKVEDGYLLLYVNGNDSSIEIVKIDADGTIQNKIKKIKNEYYKVNDFLYFKDTIFFAGQIRCPKDETCNYIANSLFLISDKDRVIEVKDRDSKIIIVSILIVLSFIGYLGIKAKRKQLITKKEKVKI